VFAVDADDVDLQPLGLFAVAAENDPLAVGRDERPAVVAGSVGELSHAGAVGIHHKDVGVAVAVAAECDQLAVLRIGPFRVVVLGVGQPAEVFSVQIGLKDIHVGIEIPFIPAADTGLLVFLLLLPLGRLGLVQLGIQMARRKQNPLAVRREVAASR